MFLPVFQKIGELVLDQIAAVAVNRHAKLKVSRSHEKLIVDLIYGWRIGVQ